MSSPGRGRIGMMGVTGTLGRAGLLVALAAMTALAAGPMALAQEQLPPKVIPSTEDKPGVVPALPVKGKDRPAVDVSAGVPLIPRSVLFGPVDKSSGRISPDGTRIAYLAPVNGVLNIWVAPVNDLSKAKAVTNETKRAIRSVFWAYDDKHILFVNDVGGDENWKVFAVNAETGQTRDLTPIEEIKGPDGKALPGPGGRPLRPAAQILSVSRKFPNEILIGLNDRDPRFHDVYRLNLASGERKLVLKNEGFAGFEIDDDYRVRLAVKPTEDGGVQMLIASGTDGNYQFSLWETIGFEDESGVSVAGFGPDDDSLYMIDPRGGDKAALYQVNLKTKQKTKILEDERTDIESIMLNPITRALEGVRVDYDKPIWTLADMTLEADFRAIRKAAGPASDLMISSRSRDDRYWTATVREDDAPAKTYLVDRGDLKDPKRKVDVKLLFVNKQSLAQQPLVPMHPVTIKSRDGLNLVSYLSLPLSADPDRDGKANTAVPMVLLVHGGPWARDSWGLDPEVQWLCNRGYAVLQVNYRGSRGFGKTFINAANREWAGKMHDDLLDAVDWAVKQGVTTKDKVAIMGGSYGGYATLVGLTFTPDVFACGVSIVGPSNLRTLLGSIPEYWQPMIETMTRRIGDHRTEEGKAYLDSRSPLSKVDAIKRPLLIGQGANDPRVKQAESDQIVKAMQAKKIPVTYVLFPDEGHGFARPENNISFYAVTEQFLAKHLGGRSEPIGESFTGSSITLPVDDEGLVKKDEKK